MCLIGSYVRCFEWGVNKIDHIAFALRLLFIVPFCEIKKKIKKKQLTVIQSCSYKARVKLLLDIITPVLKRIS